MKIDNNTKIYAGSMPVERIYAGSTIIYEKDSLPPEYERVDYLSSSHAQWIDTGVMANTLGRIETKFNTGSINSYNWAMSASDSVQVARSGTSTNTVGIGLHYFESNNGFAFVDIINYNFVANTTYEIDYKFKSGEQIIVINGDTYTANYTGVGSIQKLFLFGMNYGGRVKTSELSGISLYRTKLYGTDQTTLVRDFVPCYRIIDNKPGLYDMVTKTFYINQGSGADFTTGMDS